MRCEDSHFFVINLQFLVTKLVLLSIRNSNLLFSTKYLPLAVPVCTGGPFRTQRSHPDASCVRWRPFLFTGASE